jgi:hypothetical protein
VEGVKRRLIARTCFSLPLLTVTGLLASEVARVRQPSPDLFVPPTDPRAEAATDALFKRFHAPLTMREATRRSAIVSALLSVYTGNAEFTTKGGAGVHLLKLGSEWAMKDVR